MRSRSRSLKLPWPIDDALREVMIEEGYQNMHACIIGAIIEKVQNHRRRKWVNGIANANPKIQDYLLEKMMAFPVDIGEAIEYFRRADANNNSGKSIR